MNEDLIHFIWKNKILASKPLFSLQGEKIQIIQAGIHNYVDGPDFLQAKIQIGDKIWAGSVEIHINASDWFAHKHQDDKNYKNVILHVVFEYDLKESHRLHNQLALLPHLELKHYLPEGLLMKYEQLQLRTYKIPCEPYFDKNIDTFKHKIWWKRLMTERLQEKTIWLDSYANLWVNDFNHLALLLIARSFGLKGNELNFEQVALSINPNWISKFRSNTKAIDALIFGISGILQHAKSDEYVDKLRTEFLHLQHLLQVAESQISWNYKNNRPLNFPDIRLAQFAKLITAQPNLSSFLLDNSFDEIEKILLNINLDIYWETHFVLGKEAVRKSKNIGKSFAHRFILNTVLIFRFYYYSKKGMQSHLEELLDIIEDLPPEQNKTLSEWLHLGLKSENALESQALIYLKNNYCNKFKCLHCFYGNKILTNND